MAQCVRLGGGVVHPLIGRYSLKETMNNKSILVTVVVAPILVGYLLLQIEYSFFQFRVKLLEVFRRRLKKC